MARVWAVVRSRAPLDLVDELESGGGQVVAAGGEPAGDGGYGDREERGIRCRRVCQLLGRVLQVGVEEFVGDRVGQAGTQVLGQNPVQTGELGVIGGGEQAPPFQHTSGRGPVIPGRGP